MGEASNTKSFKKKKLPICTSKNFANLQPHTKFTVTSLIGLKEFIFY